MWPAGGANVRVGSRSSIATSVVAAATRAGTVPGVGTGLVWRRVNEMRGQLGARALVALFVVAQGVLAYLRRRKEDTLVDESCCWKPNADRRSKR